MSDYLQWEIFNIALNDGNRGGLSSDLIESNERHESMMYRDVGLEDNMTWNAYSSTLNGEFWTPQPFVTSEGLEQYVEDNKSNQRRIDELPNSVIDRTTVRFTPQIPTEEEFNNLRPQYFRGEFLASTGNPYNSFFETYNATGKYENDFLNNTLYFIEP